MCVLLCVLIVFRRKSTRDDAIDTPSHIFYGPNIISHLPPAKLHTMNITKFLHRRRLLGTSLSQTYHRVNYATPNLLVNSQVIESQTNVMAFNIAWKLRPQYTLPLQFLIEDFNMSPRYSPPTLSLASSSPTHSSPLPSPTHLSPPPPSLAPSPPPSPAPSSSSYHSDLSVISLPLLNIINNDTLEEEGVAFIETTHPECINSFIGNFLPGHH